MQLSVLQKHMYYRYYQKRCTKPLLSLKLSSYQEGNILITSVYGTGFRIITYGMQAKQRNKMIRQTRRYEPRHWSKCTNPFPGIKRNEKRITTALTPRRIIFWESSVIGILIYTKERDDDKPEETIPYSSNHKFA